MCRIRAGGGCMRVGGTVWNTLKGDRTEHEHFQISSIFIYNESLPMKSYHFFKICKRFDKERVKTLI